MGRACELEVTLLVHYHPKDEMKRHVRAFIFLETSLGKETEVAESLWKLEEVKEVHLIPGRNDVMAVAEVSRHLLEPDSQSIYWFILDRIKDISHVLNTETLIPIVSMSKWSS
ncbi:MAG: hypothetical protein AUJ07_05295 [Crenarchaeota archaeon 13_1_40CM_3_53_5]|nr:MAG: hypothetical protein AUJ07_05295 [Crenarchaeota archaeon 13_1_40CM_3_53_5]